MQMHSVLRRRAATRTSIPSMKNQRETSPTAKQKATSLANTSLRPITFHPTPFIPPLTIISLLDQLTASITEIVTVMTLEMTSPRDILETAFVFRTTNVRASTQDVRTTCSYPLIPVI